MLALGRGSPPVHNRGWLDRLRLSTVLSLAEVDMIAFSDRGRRGPHVYPKTLSLAGADAGAWERSHLLLPRLAQFLGGDLIHSRNCSGRPHLQSMFGVEMELVSS